MEASRLTTTLERYRGSLLGLAAGDALGTTLEFRQPGTFIPLDDMVGGGPFSLAPGQWTDDTSMALCLAESLVETGEFDPADQMERYTRWFRHGHLSSTDSCFDIGNTTRAALLRFEVSDDPFSGSTDPKNAGNGSIMRLAPVPLFFARNPLLAMIKSAESSRTTHGALAAVDACRYLGGLIAGAAAGQDKETLLSDSYSPVPDYWQTAPLVGEIDEIVRGSFKVHNPPRIKGSGYVVRSLEAALWSFYHSDTFAEGCLMAANLGDDADTTAAVYGQLAGAYYGEQAIPSGWRSILAHYSIIVSLAERLYELAQKQPT